MTDHMSFTNKLKDRTLFKHPFTMTNSPRPPAFALDHSYQVRPHSLQALWIIDLLFKAKQTDQPLLHRPHLASPEYTNIL